MRSLDPILGPIWQPVVKMVANTWVHTFGECIDWMSPRATAVAALGLPAQSRTWDVTYAILSVTPKRAAYRECLSFIDGVVSKADKYRFKTSTAPVTS